MIARHALSAALVALALLASAGGAAATTLSTGSLPIDASTQVRCVAVNVSTKPVLNATVAVVNTVVNPPSQTVGVCGTILPGQSCETTNGDDTSGNIYCQITYVGSSKSVRGTLQRVPLTGGVTATSDAR
ncbi:MAG TPA: hypothetical protein VFD92_23070 [Candidatus Binatia bacterium]|nr:hypothetical protein [Candidatus Binatia bacterium]